MPLKGLMMSFSKLVYSVQGPWLFFKIATRITTTNTTSDQNPFY